MKPEEQRIAIAKVCGWKFERVKKYIGDKTSITVTNPHGVSCDGYPGEFYDSRDMVYFDFEDIFNGPNKVVGPVPDYLNDLNAMNEAEKTITQRDRSIYWNELMKSVGPDGEVDLVDDYGEQSTSPSTSGFSIVHASAAQRSEAFLKTLNLWNI